MTSQQAILRQFYKTLARLVARRAKANNGKASPPAVASKPQG